VGIYDETFKSPNFGYPKGSFGRAGQEIIAVCLHITGARWESNLNWIMNPSANASYNAVVRDDGSVVSLVPEHTAAYSHGRINKATWPLLKSGINPNLYTLSLARTGANQNTWAPAQLESTLKVLKYWHKKYGVPLKRPYIFGHFEIDSAGRWYCPGRGFFDRVISELEGAEPKSVGDEKESSADAAAPGPEPETWHRVVAGSYRSKRYARQAIRQLELNGHRAFLAEHVEIDEPGSITWYRVIAGSFLEPHNAEMLAARLRAEGYDAFIAHYQNEVK